VSSTPSAGPAEPEPQRRTLPKDVPLPGDRIKPRAPAKPQFTQTVLLLEAFVVFFCTLVAYGLRTVPNAWPLFDPPSGAVIWTVGLVLSVVLLVLSRLVTRPGGYVAGTVVQVPVLAGGLAVPFMFLAGGIFAVLWVAALRLGGRVDAERAAYDAEHPETAPNVPPRERGSRRSGTAGAR
jgi:hypothetical protein